VPGERADAGVVAEHRLDHVALEPHRQVVVGALGEQVDQPVHALADGALPPQQCRRLAEILPAPARRVDGRFEQQAAHQPRRLIEVAGELRINLRIVPRETRELRLGAGDVVAENDVVVAAERTEQVVRRQHLQPERRQLQVAYHPRMQQAHDVGEARGAKAGGEFLGDRRAADDLAPLQHQGLQARPGEVRPAHQAVVPGPDHDHVIVGRHVVRRIGKLGGGRHLRRCDPVPHRPARFR
jgi:hypothetical protein